MGKGVETRARLMDIAEAAILQKGFGATSIEELIAEAGITKSGEGRGRFAIYTPKNLVCCSRGGCGVFRCDRSAQSRRPER